VYSRPANLSTGIFRRSQPGPGDHPAVGGWQRPETRKILVPVGPGSEFQVFCQNIFRVSRDYVYGDRRASARHSPPFRNGSYSPGGQGTRREDSAGALSSQGILARNRPGMRPVFGKAPEGAVEKVRTEKVWVRKERSLPPFSSGRHRYHRARFLDRSVVPSGIFFRTVKTLVASRETCLFPNQVPLIVPRRARASRRGYPAGSVDRRWKSGLVEPRA
jgi:hypothetical protein